MRRDGGASFDGALTRFAQDEGDVSLSLTLSEAGAQSKGALWNLLGGR